MCDLKYIQSRRVTTNSFMRYISVRSLLAFNLVISVSSLTASSTAIGLATANGSFQVNTSKVWGNTTLFEGSVVQTAKAPSQLKLNSGVQMRLAADSRAKVYEGRTVLEQGLGQLESSKSYPVEARSLRIYADSPGGVAQVQMKDSKKVVVAAVKGSVRVTNAGGVLVASLTPGRTLEFEPQAGAAAPTKVTGCLLRRDGKYIVIDQTTNVTVEVRGAGLQNEVGNRVEITGAADSASPSIAGASQLINASAVKRVGKGGCSAKAAGAAGAAAAAGAGAAAGAAAGIGTATTVAIVGGVAAAASVGGMAAAGTFSDEETRPSTSR